MSDFRKIETAQFSIKLQKTIKGRDDSPKLKWEDSAHWLLNKPVCLYTSKKLCSRELISWNFIFIFFYKLTLLRYSTPSRLCHDFCLKNIAVVKPFQQNCGGDLLATEPWKYFSTKATHGTRCAGLARGATLLCLGFIATDEANEILARKWDCSAAQGFTVILV